MPTNDFYLSLIENIPDEFDSQVLRILSSHVGSQNRITRKELIRKLFGKQVDNQALQTSAEDRQIRRTILNLQEQGVPVFSDSGKGGYYLGTREERDDYLKELINRRNSLDDKIKQIRAARCAPPYDPRSRPVQMSLLSD